MFPILPLLILLLMGPANAERLAVEGRLPPALLAVHRAMAVPACAVVVAPVEEEPLPGTAGAPPARTRRKSVRIAPDAGAFRSETLIAACPPRAGPGLA